MVRVAWGEGRLALRSGERRLVVWGRPERLAGLAPGVVVRLTVRQRGARTWIEDEPGGPAAPGSSHAFAHEGQLVGELRWLDLVRGELALGGLRLRSHPARLVGLLPGELLRVRFRVIDAVPWVTSLESAPGR